jgi:curli production assembly/transport component CsgF
MPTVRMGDAVSIKRFISVALLVGLSQSAMAQELVYRPISPAFGGNPNNSAYLLGTAEAQNTYRDPLEALALTPDPNEQFKQFVRQLQSRFTSRLAAQVTEAIFGEDAQESGEIEFGDQTISFSNEGTNVVLVLTNAADGTSTEIKIPRLIDTSSTGTGTSTGTGG